MDITRVLSELRFERAQVLSAIESLERIQTPRHRGVGRPPKLSSAEEELSKRETPMVSHAGAGSSFGPQQ